VGAVAGLVGVSCSGSNETFGFVERWFLRLWSRCPFIVAIDCGGWLRSVAAVRPGMWLM